MISQSSKSLQDPSPANYCSVDVECHRRPLEVHWVERGGKAEREDWIGTKERFLSRCVSTVSIQESVSISSYHIICDKMMLTFCRNMYLLYC